MIDEFGKIEGPINSDDKDWGQVAKDFEQKARDLGPAELSSVATKVDGQPGGRTRDLLRQALGRRRQMGARQMDPDHKRQRD